MKFKFKVTGIDCPDCAAKLSSMIEGRDGVESAKINFLAEKLTVESELCEAELLELVRAEAKKFDPDLVIEK